MYMHKMPFPKLPRYYTIESIVGIGYIHNVFSPTPLDRINP